VWRLEFELRPKDCQQFFRRLQFHPQGRAQILAHPAAWAIIGVRPQPRDDVLQLGMVEHCFQFIQRIGRGVEQLRRPLAFQFQNLVVAGSE
jgi:hypothetical protein